MAQRPEEDRRRAALVDQAREEATLEARLLILRSRARAGARSMQDRGTDRPARDTAGGSWGQARSQAEKVERDLEAARRRVGNLEAEPAAAAEDAPDAPGEQGAASPGVADHTQQTPPEQPRSETRGGSGGAMDQEKKEELAGRIGRAYERLVATRRELVEASEALADYERRARVENAETLLEAKNERSAALYLEGILETSERSELSQRKTQAELAHYEARSEVEHLELLVRLLEAAAASAARS